MEQIISRVPIHNSVYNGKLLPSVCKDINNFNVNILKIPRTCAHREKNLRI